MDLGIGLPNTVPGTTREELLEFARAAEEAGFSSLGTIDRIVYDNYEPLVALAAAASVTDRIRLLTSVLLAPLRGNAAHLAKQTLSVDTLAGGGRAVLGLGVGGREDDFEVSGIEFSERGQRMDAAVEKVRRVFDGEGELEAKIGPRRDPGPSLILGGSVEASFRRAARFGDGWMMGGGTPEQFEQGVGQLRAAWEAEGRAGEPRKMALGYFSLGPDAERNAEEELGDYYRLARRRGGGDDRRQRRQGRRDGEGLHAGLRVPRLRRVRLLPHLRRPRAGAPAGGGGRAIGDRGGP